MSNTISNKYRLIATPSNQGLCNHYENGIKNYIQDKEDRFWKDDYYPAWHNDRIGGERVAMVSRLEYQKQFTKNNFEQFKVARLAEIEQILKSTEVTYNTKKEILKEKYLLNQSHSYMEFGRNMNLTDSYARTVTIHNPENNPDKAQVKYNCDYVKPVIDGRYDMMQSIAFQVTNGDKLPIIQPQTQSYKKLIIGGFVNYKNTAETHTHWYQWQRTDNVERDKVAFQNIRKPAFEAKGRAEALEDAVSAIMSSPEWPLICKYHQKKNYQKNSNAYGAWSKGSISALTPLFEKDMKRKVNLGAISSEGVAYIYEDIKKIAEPALRQLEHAELAYEFISKHVNEYLDYKKENPHEIEALNNAEYKERFVLDTTVYGQSLSQTCKLMNGLCNRMVTDHQAISAVYEVSKETAIGASFFIPYAGPYIGVTAIGANIATMEEQHEMVKGWAEESDFQWLTDIKNAPVMEDAQKIIQQSQEQVRQNNNYVNRFSKDEFKKAVQWASENGDVNTKNLMKSVLDIIEWQEKPQAEKDKILQEFKDEEKHYKPIEDKLKSMQERANEFERQLKKDPNNEELKKQIENFKKECETFEKENAEDIQTYKNFNTARTKIIACQTATETGHFFANAYAENEYLAALNGDGRIKKIRTQLTEHFNANEQKMMADVEKALVIQNASNFEVQMRSDLIMKYRSTQNNIQLEPKKQEEPKQQEEPNQQSTLNESLKNVSGKTVNPTDSVDNGIDPKYNIYDEIYLY